MSELTPLMNQYHEIKKAHPGTILFFRLGDFYEMFGDDARLASKTLEITLTARQKVPMCGVPHHSADRYISRLIRSGFKVAICDQVEDPRKAKYLVKREVTRVITPGTVIEESLLSAKENNFLAGIFTDTTAKTPATGIAFADISTGEFLITELNGPDYAGELALELQRLSVAEAIIPSTSPPWITGALKATNIPVNACDDWNFAYDNAYRKMTEHFKVHSLKGMGLDDCPSSVSAAGAVLNYLEETQKGVLTHLQFPKLYSNRDYMLLDTPTRNNLELAANLRDGSRKDTLLDVLDLTLTAMGARRIKQFILQPLTDIAAIKERLDGVEYFFSDSVKRSRIREELKKISDMERLISRLNCGTANAKDLISLKNSLSIIPEIKRILKSSSGETPAITSSAGKMGDFKDIIDLIESSIVPEPPASLKEGGIIRPEFDASLKELFKSTANARQWISELEDRERKRTGINSLKVGYTGTFGYYIEITNANLKYAPSGYIRKQTLVNAERFETGELKEKEALILGAEERRNALEYELFQNIRKSIVRETKNIQESAKILSEIDVLSSLAEAAANGNYVRPFVDGGGEITITEGRHPVVEKMLSGAKFVPNDTFLSDAENQILVITGPNMSGKSTYLRQTAIIVLMAQIGSFVPAERARIGVVDRIFTRIGATDNIARGESTFMVEMMETANILNNATSKSLLVLDEIGRGTSTYDGISIAWSVVEYLCGGRFRSSGPRTLFATHYFELTDLARRLERVKNRNFAVREWNEEIVFLRKLVEGSADKSYGIHVAKLAGLPAPVLARAKQILSALENNSLREDVLPDLAGGEKQRQMSLFSENSPVMDELEGMEVEKMTPLEALNKLEKIKSMLTERRKK